MKSLDILISFLSYDGSLTNDPSDGNKIKNRIQDTNVTEVYRYQTTVDDSTTNQAVNLPDAATDYLLLFIDREITIKVNGSATALTLKPRSNGAKTFAYFQKGTISALTVSNASGAAVNLEIIGVNK